MNVSTSFSKVEHDYRTAADDAFARYSGVVDSINRSDKREERKTYLCNLARITYEARIIFLRRQFGVDKDGRELAVSNG